MPHRRRELSPEWLMHGSGGAARHVASLSFPAADVDRVHNPVFEIECRYVAGVRITAGSVALPGRPGPAAESDMRTGIAMGLPFLSQKRHLIIQRAERQKIERK
jgi:hypothetical protein